MNPVTINIHDVPSDLYAKLLIEETFGHGFRWKVFQVGQTILTFFPVQDRDTRA